MGDSHVVAQVEGILGYVIALAALCPLVESHQVFIEQRLVLKVLLARLAEMPTRLSVSTFHVLEQKAPSGGN